MPFGFMDVSQTALIERNDEGDVLSIRWNFDSTFEKSALPGDGYSVSLIIGADIGKDAL
jgi:hypothetical protein